MSFRKAFLFALVVVAVAYPATAENPFDLGKKPKPAPIPVCWSLNVTTCTSNSSCALCTFFGGKPTCFERAVADLLPPMVANCTIEEVETADEPACESLSSSDECADANGCVWCESAAIPSSCYDEADARRLPAGVFQCGFATGMKQFFGRFWV